MILSTIFAYPRMALIYALEVSFDARARCVSFDGLLASFGVNFPDLWIARKSASSCFERPKKTFFIVVPRTEMYVPETED